MSLVSILYSWYSILELNWQTEYSVTQVILQKTNAKLCISFSSVCMCMRVHVCACIFYCCKLLNTNLAGGVLHHAYYLTLSGGQESKYSWICFKVPNEAAIMACHQLMLKSHLEIWEEQELLLNSVVVGRVHFLKSQWTQLLTSLLAGFQNQLLVGVHLVLSHSFFLLKQTKQSAR